MNQQETKREQDYIKLYEASLTESDKQNIIHQSAQLKSLQESHESLDCLPIIAREDIPRNILAPQLNLQKTSSGIRVDTITQ